MKTITKTKFLALIIAGNLCVLNAKAQTVFSGNPGGTSNSCGAAGGGSNSNTSVGCGAGASTTTGRQNSAFGAGALSAITTGSYCAAFGDSALFLNNASNNNAFGYEALKANTSSTPNDAFGYQALYKNTTGVSNDAYGFQALASNTTGSYNQAFGNSAGGQNSTGNYNVSMGYLANYHNTASGNTGIGMEAVGNATTGGSNTGCGFQSLFGTTTGAQNTGLGYTAGLSNTTGSNNTYLGYLSGPSTTGNGTGSNNTFVGSGATENGNYSNATAVGSGAVVPASNEVFIGNTSVTVITGNVNYSFSDKRFKTNVKEDVKGLAFIKKLRPVTYNFDTKVADDFLTQGMPDSIKTKHTAGLDFAASTAIVHSGFIAQEVKQAGKDAGFTSSIVHTPSNSKDPYAVSYAEIVVPLVKGMQEQQQMIEKQDSVIAAMQKQLNQLLSNTGNNNNTTNTTTSVNPQGVNLSNSDVVILNQNQPNPFAEQTTITYVIPQTAGTAQIMFYDMNGKQVKNVPVTTKGKGSLTVYANDLTNGIYSYTLMVDGKIIDTKQMIKQQ